VQYVWDPTKNRANIAKHGIDFADAVAVFEDDLALTSPDSESRGELRFVILGVDGFGRHFVMVFTERGGFIASSPRASQLRESEKPMKAESDFSKARRGAVVSAVPGKTRITIRLDTDVIDWFKAQVNEAGGGNYQSLINEALKRNISQHGLERTLRRLIREELRRVA